MEAAQSKKLIGRRSERILFILGLTVRVILCGFLFEGPLKELFAPFFHEVLAQPLENPWQLLTPVHFPYGSFIFAVFYIPLKLIGIFGELSIFQISVVMKFALLGFDLLLFTQVRTLSIDKSRWALFYWCNPIVVYVSFVHGQLDLASMSLLVCSLIAAQRNRVWLSALWMVAALHSKFQVALALPILLVFFWNQMFPREFLRRGGSFLLIVLIGSSLLALPILQSNLLGYATLNSPEAQRLFALKSEFAPGLTLYWGLLILSLVMGRLLIATHWKKNSLIFASGYALTALLFVTNPAPGWFLWILPFFALLHATYPRVPGSLMLLFVGLYAIHQAVTPFWSLTVLQTFVLGYAVLLEVLVLQRHAPFFGRRKPLLIGVSGDSGSGKDYVTKLIRKVLGPSSVQVIAGDNYHRWERGHPAWKTMTHLHPGGNSLQNLQRNLVELREGQHTWSQTYDHSTGKFSDMSPFEPARNVIVQGLHTLFHADIRSQFDLKVHLSPSEDLRTRWKIERDRIERGHSEESVRKNLAVRETDSAKFIRPQARFADWEISFSDREGSPLLSMSTPNSPVFFDLAANLDLQVDWRDDIEKILILEKQTTQLSAEEVQKFAQNFFGNLRILTRGRQPPQFESGANGVVQLFMLAFISAETWRGSKA